MKTRNKQASNKKIRRLIKSKENKEENIAEKSEYRIKVQSRIEELEKEGKFDIDVEDDPPTIVLTTENIDYLRKKMTSKIKRVFANEVGERFLDSLLKNNKLIIKQVNGIENLNKISTGAIVTCNHFNPFDCFTIEKVFRMSGKIEEKRLYKVIREGNYTNFPGLYGFFFRNCDTLPLSSNKRTMVNFMKAVDSLLQKGEFILIYPEQSMWWNYRKPKPLKHGAFKIAARNNVPVIPIFITMEDSEIIGDVEERLGTAINGVNQNTADLRALNSKVENILPEVHQNSGDISVLVTQLSTQKHQIEELQEAVRLIQERLDQKP